MLKRTFDVVVSSVFLVILSPLMALVALIIRQKSPGPSIYKAKRMGLTVEEFTLYKFRSMHLESHQSSTSTAANDDRVFPFDKFLRVTKIDQHPQLWNILKGEMALVGPRPEDPAIVEEHYTLEQLRTLEVLPGLISPGSIFNYTHGEAMLDDSDPEGSYIEKLLPVKLSLEMFYVERASLIYDIRLLFRTAFVLLTRAIGRRKFREPPESRLVKREPDWMVSKSPFHERVTVR